MTLLVIGYLAIHGLRTLPYEPEWPIPGGDPERGRALIRRYGCGACHRSPGILDATGRVGPILTDLSEQVYIGGQLPNTPDHLSEWVQNPQRFAPGTAMPDLGVTEPEARNIAAYLHRKT
ncbi:MAG: c-type cytochrome [Armatimonadetes bacterium]|nr:c-type cytochrome [Armatimonadota bacterium]